MKSSAGRAVAALALLLFVGSSFAFIPPLTFASNSTTSTTPLWAFNGAYATYSLSFNYDNQSESVQITYMLSNVNPSAQTFNFTVTCSGSYCTLLELSSPSSGNGSFDSPEIPAFPVSPGSIPSNTTVTVPAGTMKVDEEVIGGTTWWIDSESGLVVQAVPTSPSNIPGVSGPYEFLLVATNIPTAAPRNLSWVALIVALVVVVVCVVGVVGYFARRRAPKALDGGQRKSEYQSVPQPPVPPAAAGAPRFCPNCGSQVAAETQFCATCGKQI